MFLKDRLCHFPLLTHLPQNTTSKLGKSPCPQRRTHRFSLAREVMRRTSISLSEYSEPIIVSVASLKAPIFSPQFPSTTPESALIFPFTLVYIRRKTGSQVGDDSFINNLPPNTTPDSFKSRPVVRGSARQRKSSFSAQPSTGMLSKAWNAVVGGGEQQKEKRLKMRKVPIKVEP